MAEVQSLAPSTCPMWGSPSIAMQLPADACRRQSLSTGSWPLNLVDIISPTWPAKSRIYVILEVLESTCRRTEALSIQVTPVSNVLLCGMDLELLCPGSSGSYKGPKVFENVFRPCEGQLLRKCARALGAGRL